jgi:putative aminopeptidase FrvX
MSVLNQGTEAFITEYLNNASPTGFESSGQKLWLKYLSPYIDEWHLDHYGTAYGVINPGQPFKVVIEGHADEISWFVNYITDDGFIYVIRNGGSDHLIAPSKRVNIHTEKGIVKGVFGWPAIHLRREKDAATYVPSMDNLFLDLGVKTKAEVLELGVKVGCVITFEDESTNMGNYIVGRALDNRMGGVCIAEVARMLKENNIKLPYSLYIVNSVQEEIGLRGAEMIARTIQPDVAIITDVTHDTYTPMITPKITGDVRSGSGPSVTFGPSVHNKLLDLIIKTAEEKNIPLQREASSRTTGTDTDAFAYASTGCPSALISLPLRYMHTTVEMAHRSDIENVILLIYETLQKIHPEMSFKYFDTLD